ncbi:cytochrome b561 domain-containing protein At2g30890-like [Tripterygium wilfordii]|uniref:cytochrome b561 domain-containing protein At2g30890-like n=1 Tax=Tripterygium wilfordii TaxID=458696 RepID=UPI0018F840EF|nr:cytochrome b561 domain-containing protein At2g30890-like [Tripterygium wilfordii]
MQVLLKLISFTVHASLIALVLPLVDSFQVDSKSAENHRSNSNIHKLSPKLLYEIKVHGFLLWASVGFLMPVGILIIRMSNREECGRRLKILFYVHTISQMLSIFLATAGAVMSIKNFNNSFNNNHQRIGVALYGIIWFQALIGFLRPQRGSRRRSVWFSMHWLLGTAISLLGTINIYSGLQAYHQKTSKSIRLWTTIFTIEISLVAFFYLFQEKWVYIQKQGVILGDEPIRPSNNVISPQDRKELVAESC